MILLRGRLDDTLANAMIAQLVLAAGMAPNPDVPLEVYLDSPGGSVTAALSIYDMMQSLRVPVATLCTGFAGGASVLILASGTAGQRAALPHARIQIADDRVDVATGRFENLDAQAEEARRVTARWRSALLRHCSQTPEQLAADLAARRWLSATEALAYGLIDRLGGAP